jgi:hypothetical protein
MTRPAANATFSTSSGLSSALRLSPLNTCVSRVFRACFAHVACVLHACCITRRFQGHQNVTELNFQNQPRSGFVFSVPFAVLHGSSCGKTPFKDKQANMRNHMPIQRSRNRASRAMAVLLALIAFAFCAAFSLSASADPPSRVARLAYITGAVSFSPAGENDWLKAPINSPLTIGDRLWVERDARAELQVGNAAIRLGGGTSAALLNLDDRTAQVQLSQGTLNVRVHRLSSGQIFEVDTPNLAFSIRKPGTYRVEVDFAGDATTVTVRNGQGEVFGDSAAYIVDAGQSYRFTGTDLGDYESGNVARNDDFDRWSSERDLLSERSVSARYVSSDVIGYEDLDNYGAWRVVSDYGNVWVPTRVASGWSPYRDGHWAWVDPWGWTWVDDAPWGFAPSHYGRWANMSGIWGWIPGPVRSRAVYAPALVAFVGGNDFRLSISTDGNGGIGWFPLGPRDVYRPSYPVSRGYFNNINSSNTVINNTQITNVYNNTNITNITYVNRQVPGAVIAVPTTTFVQSQPVARAAMRVSGESVAKAPVMAVAAVAPVRASVGGAAAAGQRPPSPVQGRSVVARTAPPPAPPGFAAQEQQLAARRGQPLEPAVRAQIKPAAVVQSGAPAVRVVRQTPGAISARPPAVAPGAQGLDQRGRRSAESAGNQVAPTKPQTAAPAPAAAPEQRGKADQRSGPPPRVQRGQVGAPQNAAPAAIPPAAVPPPAAPKPVQRGRTEQPVAPAMPVAPQQSVSPAPKPVPQMPAPDARTRADQPSKGEPQREQRVQPVAPPNKPVPAPAPAEQRKGDQPVKPDQRVQEQQRLQQQQAQQQLRQQQAQEQQRQQQGKQAQEQQRIQQQRQVQEQQRLQQQAQEQRARNEQKARPETAPAKPVAPAAQPVPVARPVAPAQPLPIAKPAALAAPPQQQGEQRGQKGKTDAGNDKRSEVEKARDEEEKKRKP